MYVYIHIERDIESRDSITDDEDGVAEVAVHVAELLGGRRGRRRYRRELVQRREVLHQERRRQLRVRREHRGRGGSGGRRGRGRHADRRDSEPPVDQWIAAFFRYVRGASNSRAREATLQQGWLLASCPDLTLQRTNRAERWWCT